LVTMVCSHTTKGCLVTSISFAIYKRWIQEPVWLHGCGCILIKTQFIVVWLKKKVIYYLWIPLSFSVRNAVKEKQRFLTFLALFMLIALFNEQYN
jgi:hypothetical protein